MAAEDIKLKHKPLIEAIFELRWKLKEVAENIYIDENYKILLGRLYDRLKKRYPFHERLPADAMPEELVGYMVHHRFRAEANKWPLVQVGPGVLTLNETKSYTWNSFSHRISDLVGVFHESYPEPEALVINQLVLRYVNGIEFDFDHNNPFDFLRDKMKLQVSLQQELFNDSGVSVTPLDFNLGFAFPAILQKGIVQMRLGKGLKGKKPAIMWEIVFQSSGSDVPSSKDGLVAWTNNAHDIIHDWFFKIIAGDLRARFE